MRKLAYGHSNWTLDIRNRHFSVYTHQYEDKTLVRMNKSVK